MNGVEVLVALAIAVGLVGILVPILPGSILVLAAILVWAWEVGGTTAWVVFGVSAAVLVAGGVVKFLIPNRRLKDAGIPGATQWIGAAVGIVGFFVIPVVGLFIGFVLGVYLAEYHRLGATAAWPSTRQALKAVGLSILIELAAGVVATFAWIAGVVLYVTVLLSLLAAAAYGLSDFNGGWVAKRVSAWTVALVSQFGGLVATLVIALPSDARPSGADLAWALLAGVGNGFGTSFLYRGLASGRMGVVAPVSGVGAAILPVATGVLIGERPGMIVWLGIALAFPAIWFVAREPSASGAPRSAGFLDGVLAGLGFGTLFVALSRVSDDAGLLPLALNQAAGGVVIVAVAVVLRQPWVPRERRAALGLSSGVLAALATWLFMVASRGNHLTVASVVVSLYPAFTVLLAALLLRERVHRAQGVGLAMCAVSVALVAAG